MSTVRFTTHRSAAVRMAVALVGCVASLSLLAGCGEAAVGENEAEPVSGKFSFDAEQARRELIQFQNRRAAWAKQYAESREESTNVNPREHLAHKDASTE